MTSYVEENMKVWTEYVEELYDVKVDDARLVLEYEWEYDERTEDHIKV